MGCVVCTTGVLRDNSQGTRRMNAERGAYRSHSRASLHFEMYAVSSQPEPLHHRRLDGLKAVVHTASEEQTSAEMEAVQPPRHIATVHRHSGNKVTMTSSSDQGVPSLQVHEENRNAATAATTRHTSQPSRLSLHGSFFPTGFARQERMLSMGSGRTGTASGAAAVGVSGLNGGRASLGCITLNSRQAVQQQQQHSYHRSLSSVSTPNQSQYMQESMLSDISVTSSTTDLSAPELVSPSFGGRLGGRNSFRASFFRGGEDLEAQRQQARLSIEEGMFVYDDIVISKNEARTKHWRLAGRKPTLVLDSSLFDTTGGRRKSRSNSLKGKKFFSFNDFDVCVDEMDWMPATAGAASSIAPLQQCSSPSSSSPGWTSVTTVCAVPNTVAHLEAEARKTAPKCQRPLRSFQLTTMLGHATRVKCIALSPAETDFASCSNEDASILLSNLRVNGEVGIYTGHQDTIINATFSPDGKYLATTSKDKSMILWDFVTTKALLTYTHPKVVICCCFSPDSKYLVSGCQDRVCRLWDTKRGKEWLCHTGHDGIIIAIAFSPDGNYVCSASADKSLRVWSATTARTRFHLTGHTGVILSCSYTVDGCHIISNDESLLCVWSAEDGSCTLSLSPADVAGASLLNARGPKLGWTLSSAAPGAFTGYMVVACNNRFVYVLDIETGEEVTSVFCKAPVYCLAAGSYEKMACGDSFGNIYILTLK